MGVMKKPDAITMKTGFCPGCGHGIVLRLVAELIEELGIEDFRVLQGVGCSCNLTRPLAVKKLQCAHGRAAAVATGARYGAPGAIICTYQGDGDAYVIGLSESMNAAYRGVNMTAIVINNNNFGMTGGQMSWTTLPGQHTSTTIHGRDTKLTGEPFHFPEIVSNFENVAYVARGAVYDAKHIRETKKYLKQALETQMNGEGYSMVEILCQCPTNWNMSPVTAAEWVRDNSEQYYKLGVFKDITGKGGTRE